MNELLKLSIEELEHILAVAPYSELHQMACALKKNQHGTGAMYQVKEGSYYKINSTQKEISDSILNGEESISSKNNGASSLSVNDTGDAQEILPDKDETEIMVEEIAEITEAPIPIKVEENVVEVEEAEEEITEKQKDKGRKKKSSKTELDEKELIEPKDLNLVGDLSAFILPDKPVKSKENLLITAEEPEDKKKKKKKKNKKSKGKKKQKEKVKKSGPSKKKSKKIKDKVKKQSKLSKERSKGKKKSVNLDTDLSDFSSWLLAHSDQSNIQPMERNGGKSKPSSKKKKKNKKKVKKDKSLVSEPLADLLASQGHSDLAIEMYEKLSLIFPEKNAFFAAKIEKIQKDK